MIGRLAAIVLMLGTGGVAAESAAQFPTGAQFPTLTHTATPTRTPTPPTPTRTPIRCPCDEALRICLANVETEHRTCLGVGCSKERAQIVLACDGTGRPLRLCKQAIGAFKRCVKGCTRGFLLRTGVCASAYKDCENHTGQPCPTPAPG